MKVSKHIQRKALSHNSKYYVKSLKRNKEKSNYEKKEEQ